MSENLVDMDSSRYLMSQDLKKYMRKFLPVLFEQYLQQDRCMILGYDRAKNLNVQIINTDQSS